MQSEKSLIMGKEYFLVDDNGIKIMVDSKFKFIDNVIKIKKIYFKGENVLLCTSAVY